MTGAVVVAAALTAAAVVVVAAGTAPALRTPTRRVRPSAAVRRRAWRRRVAPRRPTATFADADEVTVAAWCDRVAQDVRAGGSLTQAVAAAGAGPDSPFGDVAHAVGRGRALAAVFRELPGDPGTAAGLAAPVVAMCAELGGPATLALDRVASTLHARAAERDERLTASAQAQLSARILTLLPVGVLAILLAAEPSIRAVLVTPAGAACLVTGSAFDALGWCWMRRMIGAAT